MAANPKGKAGEDYAAAALEQAGARVVDRNVHSRYGEVDLVAVEGDSICFVEVKLRRAGAQVRGTAAVTPAKQRKIILTALLYLQAHDEYAQRLQPRFDVFAVTTDGQNIVGHDYIKGAFDGEAYGSADY